MKKKKAKEVTKEFTMPQTGEGFLNAPINAQSAEFVPSRLDNLTPEQRLRSLSFDIIPELKGKKYP